MRTSCLIYLRILLPSLGGTHWLSTMGRPDRRLTLVGSLGTFLQKCQHLATKKYTKRHVSNRFLSYLQQAAANGSNQAPGTVNRRVVGSMLLPGGSVDRNGSAVHLQKMILGDRNAATAGKTSAWLGSCRRQAGLGHSCLH